MALNVVNQTIISENVIKLTAREKYDFNGVLDLSKYSLQSNDDSDFVSAKKPVNIGRQSYVVDFEGSKRPNDNHGNMDKPIVNYELYLIFSDKMKNGKHYSLSLSNGQRYDFTFNDLDLVSGSIKASQIGYLPDSPKFGYIGNYLGDAGPLSLSGRACELRQSGSNNVVFTTQTKFRGSDKVLSGEDVHECDFSSYKQEGTYYLYSPGVGRTYDFVISDNVYDDVYRKLARSYYYQRASLDLESKYAGQWARKAGHLQTDSMAVIHTSHLTSPLYNGEPIGSTIDLSRGWYDAGDMGKYTLTAAPTLFELFTAYELFPGKFTDGQLNIPESGNGVPDLLDELKWETDWLRNMQAPDGGVYDRVTTTQWASTMPEADLGVRYISEKTTHTTAAYAAIMAMASRNLKPYFPEYSDDLLKRAEKSWEFLEKHPLTTPSEGYINDAGIGGGTYVDNDGDVDGRAWAAAELYKTTGKEKYHSAFIQYWKQHDPMYGHNPFQHHQQKSSFAYATTKFPADVTLIEEYKKLLKFTADEMLARTDSQAYRSSYRGDVPAWIGWGAYAHSPRYSWFFIKAHAILNNQAYLEAAKINLDPQLGNNPQYKSYITGVGIDYPKSPLHTISSLDGVAEPVPGLAVYGPTTGANWGNDCANIVTSQSNLYPKGREVGDSYPALRRYYDVNCFVEMSEFSIGDTAAILPAFAFFSSGSSGSIIVEPQTPSNPNNNAPNNNPSTVNSNNLPNFRGDNTFQLNTSATQTGISSSDSGGGGSRSSSLADRFVPNDPPSNNAEQFINIRSFESEDVEYLSSKSRNSNGIPAWAVSMLTIAMLVQIVIVTILFVRIRMGTEMPLLEGIRIYR